MADPQSIGELPDKGPADDTAMTMSQGADALADFLDDQGNDLDPVEGHEENEAAEPQFVDDEPVDEVEDEGTGEAEDEDGSEKPYDGGRFASDNAKVTLDDGTVITIADLKRNNLFQRDYTRKTEEIARERERIQSRDQEVVQTLERTTQEREFLIWFAETYAPQEPQRPDVSSDVDPMAWIKYQEHRAQFDQLSNAYSQMKAMQQHQASERETSEAQSKRAQLEAELPRLLAKFPVLNDKAKATRFWGEIDEAGQKYYGLQPGAIGPFLTTAESVQIVRDAMRYRAAQDRKPAVQKEVATKPHLVRGSQRQNPTQQLQRAKVENVHRLKQSGSLRDGIAALMDMKDL